MKFRDGALYCEDGNSRVCLNAAQSTGIAAMLLGAAPSHIPTFDDLKKFGPIRFDADVFTASHHGVPFSRDFGDSVVRSTSGNEAFAQVLAHHRSKQPGTPSAFAFAFAQQWARLGFACVHGALLHVEDTGVLVLGARATGKSVLAASALAMGGTIVSDDYILVGAHTGAVVGERIRQFVSLRRAWAANTLVGELAGVWGTNASGNRAYLRVPDDDARFPVATRIDKLWILSRPRSARTAQSQFREVGQAEVYAAAVAAIQPRLLGADFPIEQVQLTALIAHLLGLPAARLETGQDIVLAPQSAWSTLLRTTA